MRQEDELTTQHETDEPHADPTWIRRAMRAVGLTAEQQDSLLQAMIREFPVDPLLIAVVDSVEAAVAAATAEAETEGKGSAVAPHGYGELVAVDVVLGVARALLGDQVKFPPWPARIAVPARPTPAPETDPDVSHATLRAVLGHVLRPRPDDRPSDNPIDLAMNQWKSDDGPAGPGPYASAIAMFGSGTGSLLQCNLPGEIVCELVSELARVVSEDPEGDPQEAYVWRRLVRMTDDQGDEYLCRTERLLRTALAEMKGAYRPGALPAAAAVFARHLTNLTADLPSA